MSKFEQVKRYDSFEPGTMDHAGFGVEILFGEGLIREFVEEDTWDPVIRTAIAKHSDFRLEGIPDERELLHAKIIRDADKLDNCRVKLYDPVETFMGASAEEVGRDQISEEVMNELSGEGGDFEGINAYIPRTGNDQDEVFKYDEQTRTIIAELFSKVKVAASNVQ